MRADGLQKYERVRLLFGSVVTLWLAEQNDPKIYKRVSLNPFLLA